MEYPSRVIPLASWTPTADAIVLTGLAVFVLWLASVAVSRRHVAGAVVFAWLMSAVVVWVGLAAVQRLLTGVDARVLAAQFQYLGIVAVAPLWFLFCRTYASRTINRPLENLAVWIIPSLAIVAVFTNGSHHQFWTDIRPAFGDPADDLIYEYGPFFWISTAYSYLLVSAGTWDVVQALRERPARYRSQTIALAAAATVPLVVNAFYLAKLTPDLPPLGFAVSGGLFGWSLFREHLLDLTPIARGVLFDRLTDAVFVLDPFYRVLDVNAKGRALVGETTLIGVEASRVLPWWESLISGETRHPDRPAIIRSGSKVLDVAVTPVAESAGGLAGWLVVIRDVTQRRREEEERQALGRRLQEQQRVESLTLMAGGLAHDFSNILTGILGNADLLAMRLPPDATELREMVRAITEGSERAADLVFKMQAYSGQGGGPHAPVDISQLAREMVDLLRPSVAKHCQLVSETTEPPVSVLGDPTQLRQVMLNLVINAAESVDSSGTTGTKRTSGVVTVRTTVDTITDAKTATVGAPPALAPGAYVRIDVSDNGVGMDDATRTRMFDPFFSTKELGRGLGLASVLGIVKSHHGSIGVESVPGQGTTVRVWLPLP